MAALIKRAADISAITPSRYKSLMVQMSKLGYKKKEPNPVQKEKPLLLKEIIEVYMKKRNIKDIAEVAANIHLSVENFKKFFSRHKKARLWYVFSRVCIGFFFSSVFCVFSRRGGLRLGREKIFLCLVPFQ